MSGVAGWAPVAEKLEARSQKSEGLAGELLNALLGCVLVYAALFGVGEILLRSATIGVALLIASGAAAFGIARNLREPSAITGDVAS